MASPPKDSEALKRHIEEAERIAKALGSRLSQAGPPGAATPPPSTTPPAPTSFPTTSNLKQHASVASGAAAASVRQVTISEKRAEKRPDPVRIPREGIQDPDSLYAPLLQTSDTSPVSSPLNRTQTPSRHDLASPLSLKKSIRSKLKDKAVVARRKVSDKYAESTSVKTVVFWIIMVATAILSSSLSFTIDQAGALIGNFRTDFIGTEKNFPLLKVVLFNVAVVLVARLIVRTTVEAEGSGFPEMKAMLFGKIMLNFLSMRVLVVKAIGLALVVGAGLPLGKEGPNVHMAACISRTLGHDFYESSKIPDGEARKEYRKNRNAAHLLLAACAVGVGSTFSAPIGGVIFALELMLPQVYDSKAYWGCFLSAVAGSLCYASYRSWAASSKGLEPLITTDVKEGEGATTEWVMCRFGLDMSLGLVCGLLGGLWIQCHAKVAGKMKQWRLKKSGSLPISPLKSASLSEVVHAMTSKKNRTLKEAVADLKATGQTWNLPQWRDLVQVAFITIVNTIIIAKLPLLAGKGQPVLLTELFKKELVYDDYESHWSLDNLGGPLGTMIVCLVAKWFLTIFAMSLPVPTGVVAPTMIIGGLIGRVFVMLLPVAIVDMIAAPADGTPVDDDIRGAFYARFAIVGAAAFCAAVCRAFAMAITVFEVLALKNSILPLSSATLMAIFVANRISLPFFDMNLKGRGLGGIPALTHTSRATLPVFDIMRRVDVLEDCLEVHTTLANMRSVFDNSSEDFFPIVHHITRGWYEEGVLATLEGSITRKALGALLQQYNDQEGDTVMNLMDNSLTRPVDKSHPKIVTCPHTIEPETMVQDAYTMMKVSAEPVLFVVHDNCLLGVVNFKELLGHEIQM